MPETLLVYCQYNTSCHKILNMYHNQNIHHNNQLESKLHPCHGFHQLEDASHDSCLSMIHPICELILSVTPFLLTQNIPLTIPELQLVLLCIQRAREAL